MAFKETALLTVIKSCAPGKASRPNGYAMAFYQKAWEIIKIDIMVALNHFHQECHMIRWTNASFIALVPKKKGAIEEIMGQLVQLAAYTKLQPNPC